MMIKKENFGRSLGNFFIKVEAEEVK